MVNNPQMLEFLEAMVSKEKSAQKYRQENQSCNVIVSSVPLDSPKDEDGIPSSSDTVSVRAPPYDDIFCPPRGKDRDPNKLYGKELLEKKFPPHYHAIMLDNYRTVRRWFRNVSLPSDLRHNQKGKDEIMEIIHKNYSKIKPMVFCGATYKWHVEDIYKWVVAAKQSKQKYKKTKEVFSREEHNVNLKEEENKVLSQQGLGDITLSKDIEMTQGIDVNIEDLDEGKQEYTLYDGLLETDKFLMEMKSFDGLQSYEEEDVDALVGDAPLSYTELLHTGQSKRVQANKDLSSLDEVPKRDEEISCVKKASRKRKMTEKMKSLCELDHSRKTSSSKEKVACKRVNDAKNGGDEILNVHSYNEQDMETIVLVYMQKKSVHDMYFSLCAFEEGRQDMKHVECVQLPRVTGIVPLSLLPLQEKENLELSQLAKLCRDRT